MFIFLVWASQLLALFCVLLLLSWLEEDNELTCWLENNLTACKHYTVTLCKSTWMVTLVTEVGSTGEDLGGGCRGCTPLPPEMTCSFLTQLVFCIKIGSYHQSVTPFLRVYPLLREILDLPLKQVAIMYRPYIMWIFNNYSFSPNRLWVNSPWGRRPNVLLT